MKFTIIVPVYNTERYLRKCLNSIMNQEYEDYEVILVDDGSTDNSSSICDEYSLKDERIKVVHKKNGGVTSARKVAADMAIGDYITCVDSDDWISDTYLLEMSKVIEQSDPDVIVGGWFFVNDNADIGKKYKIKGFETGFYSREKINSQIFPVLMGNKSGQSFPGAIAGKVYRSHILKHALKFLPNEVTIGEDAATNVVCIYNAVSLYISDSCNYFYRYNLDSATRGKRVYNLEEPALIGKYLNISIDMMQGDFQKQLYRSTVHKLFNRCVSQFNRSDSYKTILYDLNRSLSGSFYNECIHNSDYQLFTYWKGFLAQFTLKYRLFRLIQLYSKLW